MKSNRIMVSENFKAEPIPTPNEEKDRSRGLVKWGKDNLYRYYLIDLREKSATHGGILSGKVHYIASGGLEVVSGELSKFIDQPFNKEHDMNDIAQSMVDDLETFGMMAAKGTWSIMGDKVAKWEYIDMGRLAPSVDKKSWFYSEDWTARRQDENTGYREYNTLETSNKSGDFVMVWMLPFKVNKGERGYYGKPPYISCINDADTEKNISLFHRNAIRNGFKDGTLINFANGDDLTDEEMDKVAERVRGKSSDMDTANDIRVTFSNGKETAPEVHNLMGNDADKRYLQTAEFVEANIVKGHQAVSGMLFGVKTAGQIGGNTELHDSFQIFKNTYVLSRQKFYNRAVNEMKDLSGYDGDLKLKDVPFIEAQKDETVEVVEAKKEAFEAEKDPVIEAFKTIGRSKESLEFVKQIPVKNDADFVAFESESVANYFDVIGSVVAKLSEFDKNVLSMYAKGESAISIAKANKKSLGDTVKSIENLKRNGLITEGKVTDKGQDVNRNSDAQVENFEVVYSYEEVAGLPPLKTQSRSFCKFLIEQKRVYTRQEIETISGAVDRNVWTYRGGAYTNPETMETTPWCRHFWQLNLIRKKS